MYSYDILEVLYLNYEIQDPWVRGLGPSQVGPIQADSETVLNNSIIFFLYFYSRHVLLLYTYCPVPYLLTSRGFIEEGAVEGVGDMAVK